MYWSKDHTLMDVSSAHSMILYKYVEHNFLKSSIFHKQRLSNVNHKMKGKKIK